MNNKIKTIIIAIIATMLLFSTLVSCDSGVITTKNKDVAYTEILETNGVFEYNGQYYDSLSDAIKAIEESGAEGTIKLIGDAASRPVVIPFGVSVILNLGGHELKFFDVEEYGVTVNGTLGATDGTLSFTESKDVPVILSDGAGSTTNLAESVKVEGAVTASNNTSLYAANYLSDVRMYGPASLVVEGTGTSVVWVNDTTEGNNSYATSPEGTIIDMTGTIFNVERGYYLITRNSQNYIYGGLKEAVDSLEPTDSVITLIGGDISNTEEAIDISLNQNLTLVFGDYNAGSIDDNNTQRRYFNIELNNADLTLKGPGRFVANITSEDSSLTLQAGIMLYGDVDIAGNLTSTFSTVAGTINAATVSSSDLSYIKGDVTASGYITLVGSKIEKLSTTDASPAIKSTGGNISFTTTTGESGDITADAGTVTIDNSTVSSTSTLTTGNVSGTAIEATGKSGVPVIIGGDVSASGYINLTYATLNSGSTSALAVTSTEGHISMTATTGEAGDVAAAGTVTIDNKTVSSEDTLTTGSISGTTITAEGKAGVPVIIAGSVDATTEFEAKYCTIGKASSAEEEHIYSPVVTIDNSQLIEINDIAEDCEDSVYYPAKVTITNPVSTNSVENLYSDKLIVGESASSSINLIVKKAVLSGESEENEINEGCYSDFEYSGSGKLSVRGGYFSKISSSYDGKFTHSGTGSVSITGGIFEVFDKQDGSGDCEVSGNSTVFVWGDSTQDNLETINKLISLVKTDSENPVTIVYAPQGLVPVTGDIQMNQPYAGKVELEFSYSLSTDSKATNGIYVAATENDYDCVLTFEDGENVSLSDSSDSRIFVAKGATLISDISLDGSTYKHVYKIRIEEDTNTVGDVIAADTETIPGKFVYNNPMTYTVTFNANGGTASETSRTVNPGDSYGTLPTATKTGYEISGWYTEIESGTEVTETMVPTDDITLYAHWKQLVLKPATVEPHKAIVSNSKLYNADGTVLSEAETGIVPDPNQTNYKYYYVNTSDTDCVVYGKYNYNYHYIEIRDYYSTEYHYANLESSLGLIVVQALADANGKTELYFNKTSTDTGTKVKYYKDGSEWKFEVGASSSGTIYSVHFDGTGQHFNDN